MVKEDCRHQTRATVGTGEADVEIFRPRSCEDRPSCKWNQKYRNFNKPNRSDTKVFSAKQQFSNQSFSSPCAVTLTTTHTQSGGVEGASAHVHAAGTLLPAREVKKEPEFCISPFPPPAPSPYLLCGKLAASSPSILSLLLPPLSPASCPCPFSSLEFIAWLVFTNKKLELHYLSLFFPFPISL